MFSDGVFVRSAIQEQKDLVGTRVIKIGDEPISEAIGRVTDLFGKDNEMGVKFFAPLLLTMPEILHAVGLSKSVNISSFTVETEGRHRVVKLAPIGPVEILPADTDTSWMPKDGWVDMRDKAKAPTPLWLKNANLFWIEYLENSKTVYAQINQVGNKQDETLQAFSKRLLAFVEAKAADKLVLDLRLNRGGNGQLLLPLEIALLKSGMDQKGKLFILMGRSTWSASQFFLNWTQKHTNAVFVGEPSASKGNVYGDSRRITLPNSGITTRVSVYYWQDWSPWDTRVWTAPHVTAELSSAEYMANVDPVLRAAIDYKPQKSLEDVLEDALTEGGAETAVKRYRQFKAQVINKYADTEEPLLKAGQRMLNEKKPEQALVLFQLVRDEHPNSYRGYFAIGAALSLTPNKADAIKNLEQALRMSPKNYDVHNLLRQIPPTK